MAQYLPVSGKLSPATNNTDLMNWRLVSELTMMIAERAWRSGNCYWPFTSYRFYTGVVGSVMSGTSLTDANGTNWCAAPCPIPWTCGCTTGDGSTAPDQAPGSWTLCIDDWPASAADHLTDPAKVVESLITGWDTNTGRLYFSDISDHVASGQISSLSQLNGRNYAIIKGGGTYWSDAVLEWPNDMDYAFGTVATSTHLAFTAVPAAGIRWKRDQFKGKDALFYADDGKLKRVRITSNGSNAIGFAQQTYFPATNSNFVVVSAGNRAIPGRARNQPWAFYRGYRESFATHEPTADGLGGVALPVPTVAVPASDGAGGCTVFNAPVFDSDFYTGFPVGLEDLACGRPIDHYYATDRCKTIRGLQKAIEDLAYANAVEDKDYTGSINIPTLGFAEAVKLAIAAAGTNQNSLVAYTAATGSISGSPSGNVIGITGSTVSAADVPLMVHYSIHTDDGLYTVGRGIMTATNQLQAETSAGSDVFNVGQHDGGRTVVISPGWSAFSMREVARLFPQTTWIADEKSDGMGGFTAIDPPSLDYTNTACIGAGTWYRRAKSTKYINRRRQVQDWNQPSGFAWEDGDALKVGDLVRYCGNEFFSPVCATGLTPSSASGVNAFLASSDVLAPYWQRFFLGRLADAHQSARDAQLKGTATDGGAGWIEDTGKDWYDFQWFGGVLRIESGTATAGSTLGLTDSSKASGSNNCAWAAARFQGFTNGTYSTFPVEVDFGAGTSRGLFTHGNTEVRQVASGSASGALSFTQALLRGSANGQPYRIVEPKAINRYEGRTMTLTSPQGVSYKATNTGNWQRGLFFTPALVAGPGWKYSIDDARTGGIWQCTSTNGTWIDPAGKADSARVTVQTPAKFHASQFENNVTWKRGWGRLNYRDGIFAETYNELYWLAKVMTAYNLGPFPWVHNPSENDYEAEPACTGGGCVNDSPYSPAVGGTEYPDCIKAGTNSRDCANAKWGTAPVPGGCDPFAISSASLTLFGSPCGVNVCGPDDGCQSYSIARAFAYGQFGGLCTRQSRTLDFYAYAELPNTAVPDGAGTCVACLGGAGTITSSILQFDANGDPVLLGQFSKFGSDTGSNAVSGSVRLGGLGLPNGAYPDGCTNHSLVKGYAVTRNAVIARGPGLYFT